MRFQIETRKGHKADCSIVEHWTTKTGYLVVKIKVNKCQYYEGQIFVGGQNFYQPKVWAEITKSLGLGGRL